MQTISEKRLFIALEISTFSVMIGLQLSSRAEMLGGLHKAGVPK